MGRRKRKKKPRRNMSKPVKSYNTKKNMGNATTKEETETKTADLSRSVFFSEAKTPSVTESPFPDVSNCKGKTASYGSYYVNIPEHTKFDKSNVWKKMECKTSAGPLSDMEHTENRLTYSPEDDGSKAFHILINALIENGYPGRIYELGISKNGDRPLSAACNCARINTTADSIQWGCSCIVTLEKGDYIEMWGRSIGGADPLDIVTMTVTCVSL